MNVRFAAASVTRWIILAGLTVTACQPANEFQPPPPPQVTVARPLRQSVVAFMELPGQTRAIESVEVRARVEGFLQSVDFEEGAEVAQGALLYTIEPERYEAAVKTAEARWENANAALAKAEYEHGRVTQLQTSEADPAARINAQAAPGFSTGDAMTVFEQMAAVSFPPSIGFE